MPPVIDRDTCSGCGGCVFQCGVEALKFDPRRYRAYLARPKACVDCFICEDYCYRHAITVRMVRWKE